MPRIRIKFCGITRPADALTAADAGADAIGLVFHPPARRNISVDQARHILSELPPFITPVALFVDAETPRILDLAAELRIHHIQLHGHESPERLAELRGLTLLKALRADPRTLQQDLRTWRDAIARLNLTHLRGFVLETPSAHPGGTGLENDWATIRHHQSRGDFADLPPIIAAGGLTPQNVAHVVQSLRPYAVDVSSGIETKVGEKSPEKMIAFVKALRQAESAFQTE